MSEKYEKAIETMLKQANEHYYIDMAGKLIWDSEQLKTIAIHLALRLVRAIEQIAKRRMEP